MTTYLYFLPYKILKAFPKTFRTEIKQSNWRLNTREKNGARKVQEDRSIPELQKLIVLDLLGGV